MAQTTRATSSACAQVEVSIDGSVWADVSGSIQSVSDTEQTRMSGEIYTFRGDGAIVRSGKREPMSLAFAIVYTEDTGEAYEIARSIFELVGCNKRIYVRYVPRHGTAGASRIGSYGPIVAFVYPPVAGNEAGPIMGGFTVRVVDLVLGDRMITEDDDYMITEDGDYMLAV